MQHCFSVGEQCDRDRQSAVKPPPLLLSLNWAPAVICAACLQDLSPILPGPAVTDTSQLRLRQAVLECISVLARRVGDSLHLLEAMGGIVGKLAGPSPLSTAVLDCVVAASGAVNSFSAKVSCSLHCSGTCL